MKHIIGLVCGLAALLCVEATPVKSNLGSRGVEDTESGNAIPENPTAADYVQDGLVHLWDGIENVDWNLHDDMAPRWIDLVNGVPFPDPRTQARDCSWTDSGLICDGNLIGDMYRSNIGDYLTTEATFKTVSSELQFLWINLWRRDCLGVYGSNVGVGLRQSKRLGYNSMDRVISLSAIFPDAVSNTSERSYANGTELTTTGTGNFSEPATSPCRIGYGYNRGGFVGEIYCIRMYNRALTPEEIAYNYEIDKVRFGL